MKAIPFVLTLVLSNFGHSQSLTATTELSILVSSFNYYLEDPCESVSEGRYQAETKKMHFIKLVSCQDDPSKLRGFVYGLVVIDGAVYRVPLSTCNLFSSGNDDFLLMYKQLKPIEREALAKQNLSLNKIHYTNLRESEKIRLEQEAQLEKERKEQEKQERIRQEARERGMKRAVDDSLKADSLRYVNERFVQNSIEIKAKTLIKINKGRELGGILITQFSFSQDDYGNVELTLGIHNLGKKRIKYATFKMQATNAVDDPIGSIESFKGIGYVEPEMEGVWTFDEAWYDDLIEFLVIKSVTLVFEDGSTKTITKPGEIRVDNDEEILNCFKNKEYKETALPFGTIALITHPEGRENEFFLLFLSNQNGKFQGSFFSRETLCTLKINLDAAINHSKFPSIATFGPFEIKEYSSQIYFFSENQYTLLKKEEAVALSNHMEYLCKSEE
jgi:hypothetical protein